MFNPNRGAIPAFFGAAQPNNVDNNTSGAGDIAEDLLQALISESRRGNSDLASRLLAAGPRGDESGDAMGHMLSRLGELASRQLASDNPFRQTSQNPPTTARSSSSTTSAPPFSTPPSSTDTSPESDSGGSNSNNMFVENIFGFGVQSMGYGEPTTAFGTSK
jgi:hypothetical protein